MIVSYIAGGIFMSEEQNNIKEYGTVNSDGIEIVTIIGET